MWIFGELVDVDVELDPWTAHQLTNTRTQTRTYNSDKEPALVMDRLLEAFTSTTTATTTAAADAPTTTAAWQYRLKAGEALAQSLQRCGEAMPVYASKVLPAFIRGAQPGPAMTASSASSTGEEEAEIVAALVEEEGHFRASCLSGLGDVCEALGWALQRPARDVCGLAAGILAMEQGGGAPGSSQVAAARAKALALVRRGAAFLLERLALGLGPARVLAVLGFGGLQEVTEAARRCAERDRDAVARLHARRALAAFEAALLEQVYERVDPSRAVTALEELVTVGTAGARGAGAGGKGEGLRLPGVGEFVLGRGGGRGK